jgi:LAO/AO transport system kinase
MPSQKQLDDWFYKRKTHKQSLSAALLFPALISGNRGALSSAITLVESQVSEDRKEANTLIKSCSDLNKKAWRIGITGVPGVGKSTFIEAFGKIILEKGLKLAVLAIDPSSNVSGGSILGDKTRMPWLSQQENAFIRPSATRNNLGGVALNTREAILLCEAAGFDIIFIETVGVGQSETVVHSMVDFFLLLMLSGAGDELQGIKRGIMEMADLLVITKADGDNLQNAKNARSQYANALHLFPSKPSTWTTQALISSSVSGVGLHEVLEATENYFNKIVLSAWLDENRRLQEITLLKECLSNLLKQDFFGNDKWKNKFLIAEQKVANGKLSAFIAAEQLFKEYDLRKT